MNVTKAIGAALCLFLLLLCCFIGVGGVAWSVFAFAFFVYAIVHPFLFLGLSIAILLCSALFASTLTKARKIGAMGLVMALTIICRLLIVHVLMQSGAQATGSPDALGMTVFYVVFTVFAGLGLIALLQLKEKTQDRVILWGCLSAAILIAVLLVGGHSINPNPTVSFG